MAVGLTDLLLAVIRCSIFGSELTEDQERKTRESLPEIIELAKHHDLSHLLFDVLACKGIVTKSDELYSGLEKAKLTALFRSVKMDAELKRITTALSEAGIEHIPLKGAVIKALYPEAHMRTSCDIDVLVREESVDLAASVLCEKLMYTTNGEKHFHDLQMFSPAGINLELHFSILENMPNIDGVLSRVFDYAFPVKEGSYTLALSNEFLIFHLLAHCYYHFVNGGSGIKPFIDLKLALSKLDHSSKELKELCSEASVLKFLEGALSLSEIWFGNSEHTESSRRLEKYIINGGVYGSRSNHNSVKQNKAGGKLRHILSLIFVPYSSLRIMYPVLDRHPILTPICHIRRWCRIIFCGGVGRSVKIIKQNARVNDDERAEIAELFRELEL